MTAELFEKAILFAVKAHQGQLRKGDRRPYILHPLSVMHRVYTYKKSSNIFLLGIVAILHDVVEDCGIPIQQIADEFGYKVAALVDELTTDKEKCEALGKKVYLLQKMLAMSSYALVIKLSDRLDNVSDLLTLSKEKIKKTINDTEYILDGLVEGRKLSKTHKKFITLIRKECKHLRKNCIN